MPASAPATKAAAVARSGCTWATISTAATAPPSVMEPSAVMSANSKIRKLTKTPNASSESMSPIVSAPISSSTASPLPSARYRADPARAAHELALADAGGAAVVV